MGLPTTLVKILPGSTACQQRQMLLQAALIVRSALLLMNPSSHLCSKLSCQLRVCKCRLFIQQAASLHMILHQMCRWTLSSEISPVHFSKIQQDSQTQGPHSRLHSSRPRQQDQRQHSMMRLSASVARVSQQMLAKPPSGQPNVCRKQRTASTTAISDQKLQIPHPQMQVPVNKLNLHL